MPASRAVDATSEPDCLRSYLFHGMELATSGGHAIGDCPFCGRDGKFSVDVRTGLYRCLVCGTGTAAGGGNGLVFTRLYYEKAVAGRPEAFTGIVAGDRGIAPGTVVAWGVASARSTWLVPGYGTDGRLDQVYRRILVYKSPVVDGRTVDQTREWKLLPTPGIWPEGRAHALHLPAADFDPARPNLIVCEGPWDGMALWEAWDRADKTTNIVAVPGCNVWRDDWTRLCKGKHVTLMFDSDHPRTVAGKVFRAGYDGMERITKRLSGVAQSVQYLRWGPDGYDPNKPSGYDVRDFLNGK